jgi:uncharacterized membrane protein HdeD (DUF308 family)/predicted flap endonuclease-1-like 5' DNA nuclease
MSEVIYIEQKSKTLPWWLLLIPGLTGILLGLALFIHPVPGLSMLVKLLGIYWLFTGFLSIISIFADRSGWGWKLVGGVLGVLAGILVIQNPFMSTLLLPATLAFTLGLIGVVMGVVELIGALRGDGWGMGVLGALSILLGLLLIARPAIAGLALSWVIGSLLFFGGVLIIFAGFAIAYLEKYNRDLAKHSLGAAQAEPVSVSDETRLAEAPLGEYESLESANLEAAIEETPAAEAEDSGGWGALGVAAAGVALAEAHDEPEETYPEEEPIEAEEPVPLEEFSGVSRAEEFVPETQAEEFSGASRAEEIAFAAVAAEGLTTHEEAAPVEAAGFQAAPVVPVEPIAEEAPTPMATLKHPLEYVEGIGPVYAAQLKGIGLVTCLDLLKEGASRKGREEISEKTGISPKLVLKWVNHVDLYRIKGIGSEYADLLEAAGVDTVVELAQRNPSHLFEKMSEVFSAKGLVRKMPTEAQVAGWVEQAKHIPRAVSY